MEKVGKVRPLGNLRYEVDSFSGNQPYKVRLDIPEGACTCKAWSCIYNPRFKETGVVVAHQFDGATECKHIMCARSFHDRWECLDDRANELIGQICAFSYQGKWFAGEIVSATPNGNYWIKEQPVPNFDVTIEGRTGKQLQVDFVEAGVYPVNTYEQADEYTKQHNTKGTK